MNSFIKVFLVMFVGAVIGFAISIDFSSEDVVRLNWTSDPVAVQQKFELYQEEFVNSHPRGVQQNIGGVCNIWLLEPVDGSDRLQMEILGHEVLHCYWGRYHD